MLLIFIYHRTDYAFSERKKNDSQVKKELEIRLSHNQFKIVQLQQSLEILCEMFPVDIYDCKMQDILMLLLSLCDGMNTTTEHETLKAAKRQISLDLRLKWIAYPSSKKSPRLMTEDENQRYRCLIPSDSLDDEYHDYGIM